MPQLMPQHNVQGSRGSLKSSIGTKHLRHLHSRMSFVNEIRGLILNTDNRGGCIEHVHDEAL